MRPDEGGGPTFIHLDAETADNVRNQFNDLAAEFDNTRTPLRNCYTKALGALGEFRSELDDGASRFFLSWNDVFGVCSKESALIAGNINRFSVDLTALDRDSSTTVQL